MGIPYLSWEEIIPQCDVVSLHMPLLPSTKYFIDVRFLGGGGAGGSCVACVALLWLKTSRAGLKVGAPV